MAAKKPKTKFTNPGPPKGECIFDYGNGKLEITVRDPQTSKLAAACAITLAKADAKKLFWRVDAYANGLIARKFKLSQSGPPPFTRECIFDSKRGLLTVALGNASASATFPFPSTKARREARLFADALDKYST